MDKPPFFTKDDIVNAFLKGKKMEDEEMAKLPKVFPSDDGIHEVCRGLGDEPDKTE